MLPTNPFTTRWIILVLGILANMSMGVTYSGSVISEPILLQVGIADDPVAMKKHWATVFMLGCCLLPVGMMIAGKLVEKWGPRLPIFLGAVLYSSGLFVASVTTTYPVLCVSLGAMISVGSGLAYGPIVASAVRWFPDRRGLASGVVVGALGFGPVLIAPTSHWLLNTIGWDITTVLQLLGGVALFAIGAASFITTPTAEFLASFSQKPKTAPTSTELPLQPSQPQQAKPVCQPKKEYRWNEMIVTSEFWTLFFLFILGALPGLMLLSQAKGIFVTLGISPATAVSLVAVLAAMNALGRVLWGTISDYLGRPWTLVIMFFCSATAMFLFPFATTSVLLIAVILAVGTTYGGYLGLFPSFCADAFGPKNMSMNYAVLFTGFSTAAIAGPFLYASLPSPDTAFLTAAGLSTFGLLLAVTRATWKTTRLRKVEKTADR